uniref:Uncharacterized protein n=1 Tax=Grateloupia filicina TaxID=31455 RepID=A0A2S1FXH4_9FLOR|nr:hypothetical protein Grafi_p106 [Grateloupia filicina]AWD77450.1 hypothetical protein Grafi_p106 [Grateloupia filicina]
MRTTIKSIPYLYLQAQKKYHKDSQNMNIDFDNFRKRIDCMDTLTNFIINISGNQNDR